MKIEAIQPKINPADKFAVAVRVEGGNLCVIQTCATRAQLSTVFLEWQSFAALRGITKPVPIEIIDEELRCRILKDILEGN